MVKVAYDDVIDAVMMAERREREYCERFCQLNPEHRHERERMRDMVLAGIHDVYTQIIHLDAARRGH